MKIRFLTLIGLIVLLAGCTPAAATQPLSAATAATPDAGLATQAVQPQSLPDYTDAIFRKGLTDQAQAALENLQGASIYTLDFTIAEDFRSLQGHEAVLYTNREDVPLNEIYFRLFPNVAGGWLKVSGVTVDQQPVKTSLEAADSSLRIALPASLQPGERLLVELDFEETIPSEAGGNFGIFGYLEDVLVLDTFYPVVSVYDDLGWYKGIPSRTGDIPYSDASFYQVRVSAPSNLKLVASGVEVDRKEAAQRQIVTYAAGPARDFYLAGSQRFMLTSKTVGAVTINSYGIEEFPESAQSALEMAERALQIFSQRFGDYPYTELDIVSTPMQALGVEYPGVTAITLAVYDPEAVISGTPAQVLRESVIAHEVAHQWFYNVVGNHQTNEPWLDEALVQYLVWLYYLDAYGKGPAESYRQSWFARWDRVERASTPVGLVADAYEPKAYSAIVYGRGPLFIEALAKEMGAEAFDAFLRDYYTTNMWGIATGKIFRQLAEKHCACDLAAVFEEWVYP